MSEMESETDGLIALCDKTSNDIRSCLNTLQFLSKRTKKITSKLVNELNIGQKDIEKNIFSIMSEIFFKKFEKK
jgi:chromosome transmission fidelity protein 18